MIYTSYFAKMKKYPNIEFISIARFTPKGINIPTLKELMPSEELLKKYKAKQVNEEEYARIYRQQLDNLDRMALGKMLQGKCLLCFEKPPTFCHRHLVAEWFRVAGFETKELD